MFEFDFLFCFLMLLFDLIIGEFFIDLFIVLILLLLTIVLAVVGLVNTMRLYLLNEVGVVFVFVFFLDFFSLVKFMFFLLDLRILVGED